MNGFNLALVCILAGVAADDHRAAQGKRPSVLMPGMGRHHHPVSTKKDEAQRFFDQGLTLIYAFNHDEAAGSFRRAAEIDPDLAMAQWGLALALGPNYNLPEVDAEQAKAANEAMQKAIALASRAPEHERAYIEALAKRYSEDPKADGKKLLLDYKNAMADLARRYPDDLDAATLYAESAMNLRPWKLWTADGKPAEGTEEIVAVLEGVLRRNPDHPGANHYYIHAVEASLHPERALPSAARLADLVPAAGHLVHMPGHIYFRVGDYEASARANERAIVVDRAYIKRTGATGVYPMMYFSHNIHFLAAARTVQGRYSDAKQAADDLVTHIAPHVEEMPMLEPWMAMPLIVRIRFRQWDEILAMPRPAEGLPITTAIWRLARGLALAAQGKADEAEQERQQFSAAKAAIPAETTFSDNNKAQEVLAVAEQYLDARIALARSDLQRAIESFRSAVKLEDALSYVEPPDAFLRVRESFGGSLLRQGAYAEAEQVFREDLARQPRNGRSLFGLMESLKGQKKAAAARLVELEFRAAWNRAEGTALSVDDL